MRIRTEFEHRLPEVGRRIPASAAQLRPEQVDELVRLYGETKSVKGLARHLGIHNHTVRKHLKARGAEIVQPGLISPEQLTLAIELHEAGQSGIRIGKRLRFDNHTIIHALRQSGVKIRAQLGRS
ncbi:hypothetical protein [Candidatus Aquiluna sp. UB-MaderosW2red]|uniref:hypothetical protein n=1 Tax=Candidatus Aquiluna sp. UB-MaderosW2red TaxID=1855377 RepID=UPI0012F9EFB8|nr:hypothetical protein [Candidatus Aquiluna sp. UB-MaderosW2red]